MTLAGRHIGTSAGAHPLARYRSEFPIFREGIYLNTCSLGALGERTHRRVTEFLDVWQRRGGAAGGDAWGGAPPGLRPRHPRGVKAAPAGTAPPPGSPGPAPPASGAADHGGRPPAVVTSRH